LLLGAILSSPASFTTVFLCFEDSTVNRTFGNALGLNHLRKRCNLKPFQKYVQKECLIGKTHLQISTFGWFLVYTTHAQQKGGWFIVGS